MTKVDEAIAEINAALADIAPAHEGLRDFSKLNLNPDSLDRVLAAIGQYDRRVQLLTDARDRLTALVSDGYPTLEIPPVSISVFQDLHQNETTIEAAMARFSADAAASLDLKSSPAEPK